VKIQLKKWVNKHRAWTYLIAWTALIGIVSVIPQNVRLFRFAEVLFWGMIIPYHLWWRGYDKSRGKVK
jgi:hypothetical protein